MTLRLLALAALTFCLLGFTESALASETGRVLESPFAGIETRLVPPLAQADWPPYQASGGTHDIQRGPGGYISWIKMLLVVIVFMVWIRLTDWLNRDAQKFSEHTGQTAEVWNPIIVLAFLGGLVAVFAVPSFMAGFPLYVALAFLPWTIYQLQRRGQIPEDAITGELFTEKVSSSTSVPIDIKPAGSDSDASQANLIRARQSPQFDAMCVLLHDSVRNRIDQVLLDYTREQVGHRIQVDGLWHQMQPIDRETGDAMLWALKTIGGLNAMERRQQQHGIFNAKVGREKAEFDMITQGVPTGERVLIKLIREASLKLELPELGMSPTMQEKLLEQVEASGIVIVSSPPGQGLTASWQALLNGADRFTRDFVGVADYDDRETERENVELKRIDSRKAQSAASLLPGMILKQPNVFVMSKIADKPTMDLLTEQVTNENRTVLTRVHANSAAEAILRLMTMAGNREKFLRSVTAVTCQRLVRKLCDECKKPVQANPQAIQQMGGDPRVHTVLYKDYQLPPVEARIDADGKPVHMEPCRKCNGIGFLGRTAIYELLLVNQAVRDVLLKTPKLELVSQVARQQGNLTLMQQAYRAVLEGRTCMAEVQRVFQPRK